MKRRITKCLRLLLAVCLLLALAGTAAAADPI